jgi:NikR C terminal nickel binding domain
MQSTATTRSWRDGAIALRKILGLVGIFRWSRISPSRLTLQADHGPGMPTNATVGFVHAGIESHWPSSSLPIAVCVMSIPDYDHHVRQLPTRLIALQRRQDGTVLATMHVHLDAAHCLGVLVLQGMGAKLRCIADRLIGMKGVVHGKLVLIMAGPGLP